MKTNKILLYTLLALPALLMQSCLKDQEDIFDKPYSQRMEEYLQAAQDSLVSAPYGWAFDYYPENNQSYGGFTYTIAFSKDADTVRFENNPDDGKLVSLYKMKEDDGPVLSFDTYNNFLHKYATPSNGKYQGYKGDFEFVIDSVGNGVVKVHGKKSGNTLYLRKLTEPANRYMAKVVDMGDSFMLSEADLTIGGKPYEFAFTDLTNRQIDIYDNGQYLTTTAYNFTDKGLRLYQPLMLNGVSVQDINYDDANLKMSANGVETSKLWVSPEIIASLIGNIRSGYNGKTVTKIVPHLDQVEISSDASWVHISKNGNELTIKLDASADKTKMRKATIVIKNGNDTSAVTVTQFELSSLLGSYKLSTGSETKAATLAYGMDDAGKQQLYLSVSSNYGTYQFPLIYLSSSQMLLMQSGQLLGSIGEYYLANVFFFNNNADWTEASDQFFDLLQFGSDENGNMMISLNGTLLYTPDGQTLQNTGYSVDDIFIEAFTAYPFTSSSIAGYVEKWGKSTLVKTASAPAKEYVGTGREMSHREYQMRAVNPVRRSYFDLTPYHVQAPLKQLKIK